MRNKKYKLTSIGLLCLLLAGSGCSSSLFTSGAKKAKEIDRIKSSGAYDSACFNLDLSDSYFDVRTARSLIKCLNSNGSIKEFDLFVSALSYAEFQTFLDVINSKFLNYDRNRRLKEAFYTFDRLRQIGTIDRFFNGISKLLENPQLLQSGLKILRQGTAPTCVDLSEEQKRKSEGFIDQTFRSIKNLVTGESPKTQIACEEGLVDSSIYQALKLTLKEASTAPNSEEVKPEILVNNLTKILDQLIEVSSSRAFQESSEYLKSSFPLFKPEKGLDYFTPKFHQYLKEKIIDKNAWAKVALWGTADGELLDSLDVLFNKTCDYTSLRECKSSFNALDTQVQSFEELLKTLTITKKAEILSPLVEAMSSLNGPINCLADTKQIPNVTYFFLDELNKLTPLDVPLWFLRDNSLKVKMAAGLCDFPNGKEYSFNQMLSTIRKLALDADESSGKPLKQGRPLITSVQLFNSLAAADETPLTLEAAKDILPLLKNPVNRRHRGFSIDLVGDKTGAFISPLSEVIAEFVRDERPVIGNVLYLANFFPPQSEERKNLQKALRFSLILRDELKSDKRGVPGTDPARGRSLLDLVSEAILKVETNLILDFFKSSLSVLDSDSAVLKPVAESAREALLSTNANPIVEIVLDIGLHPEENKKLIETFLMISEKPEFVQALSLAGKMAREGTLKSLIFDTFKMFNTAIQRAPGTVIVQDIPPVKNIAYFNDYSVGKRRESGRTYNPPNASWSTKQGSDLACSMLDADQTLGFPFQNLPAWRQQIDALSSCINDQGQYDDLESALKYASTQTVKDKPLLAVVLDAISTFVPSSLFGSEKRKIIFDELSDVITDTEKFEDLKTISYLTPFLFEKRYCSVYSDDPSFRCTSPYERVSLVQVLGRVLGLAADQRNSFQVIFKFLGDVITDKNIGPTLALLNDSLAIGKDSNQVLRIDRKPPLISYPVNNYPMNQTLRTRLAQAIKTYEGKEPTEAMMREKEINYYAQILPDEEKKYVDDSGRIRLGYKDAEEFKKYLKPLLDEIARGERLESMMRFLYRMYSDPYTPEWWGDWFKRTSSNVIPIPYYYPGSNPEKETPVVRLVSQLDLLDLVVLNADFNLDDIGQAGFGIVGQQDNFAIKYLSLVAMCDEDMTPALKAMRRDLDFFGSLTQKLPGEIPLPIVENPRLFKVDLKRRLYNLNIVYQILTQMNRVTEFKGSDGKVIYVNDLGILRDIFKSLLSSIPDNERNMEKNPKFLLRSYNPMVVIEEMVRVGVLRNISKNIWYLNDQLDQKKIHNFDDNDMAHRAVVPNQISPLLKFVTRGVTQVVGKKLMLNPDAVEIANFLLKKNCDQTSKEEYKRLPCVPLDLKQDPRSFNERYQLIGKIIDKVFEWQKNDDFRDDRREITGLQLLKRFAYSSGMLISKIQKDQNGREIDLNKKFVTALKPILTSEKNANWLVKNLDLFDDVAKDPIWVKTLEALLKKESDPAFVQMRALFQLLLDKSIENDSNFVKTGVQTLALVSDRSETRSDKPTQALQAILMHWMPADAELERFRKDSFDPVFDKFINWMAGKGENKCSPLRDRAQEFLAEQFKEGMVLDIVEFMAKESEGTSDKFYSQFEFAGKKSTMDSWNDFLVFIKSGIQDVSKRQNTSLNDSLNACF